MGSILDIRQADGSPVVPEVPFSQLASFLRHNVQSISELWVRSFGAAGEEATLFDLLARVEGLHRFDVKVLMLDNFFRHLSWPQVQLLFNERLAAGEIRLHGLTLPSGVGDTNRLLEMAALRNCTCLKLRLQDHEGPSLPPPPGLLEPRFTAAAVLGMLKQAGSGSGSPATELPDSYLIDGVRELLRAVKAVSLNRPHSNLESRESHDLRTSTRPRRSKDTHSASASPARRRRASSACRRRRRGTGSGSNCSSAASQNAWQRRSATAMPT